MVGCADLAAGTRTRFPGFPVPFPRKSRVVRLRVLLPPGMLPLG